MKHLVQFQATPQAALKIESRPGGPPAVINRLVERFKPEAVYMSPAKRAVIMVCDLTPTDMAEFMIVGGELYGQYPEFLPVISGSEFGALVAKVLPGAKKLIEG